jgi:hypothetical protein
VNKNKGLTAGSKWAVNQEKENTDATDGLTGYLQRRSQQK